MANTNKQAGVPDSFDAGQIQALLDNNAKAILKAQLEKQEVKTVYDGICYEDVLVQLFKDGKIVFIDHNEDKKYEFTPAFVRSNLEAVVSSDEPITQAIEFIIDSLSDDGDADAFDHWNILQYMLFKELIYG